MSSASRRICSLSAKTYDNNDHPQCDCTQHKLFNVATANLLHLSSPDGHELLELLEQVALISCNKEVTSSIVRGKIRESDVTL